MPNAEKKINAQLLKSGVETFLPLITRTVQWSDRKKKVSTPLFPGYLFVKPDHVDHIHLVLRIGGVVRLLYRDGRLESVTGSEIATIKKMIDHAPALEVGHFEIGQEIEISSGHLKGIKGQFIRRNGRNKLVVSVSSIQQSILVELPAGAVVQ